MSFNGFKSIIQEGDLVILYLSVNQIYALEATATTKSKKGALVENVYQTPFGAIKGSSLIGQPFGSRLHLSKGWVHVLQPTPEFWTKALPHRTQIIYTPDISMIILQLEIKPGSVVIECGTGSGSLSHALIRTVKPHGRLYTFDFHEIRVCLARDEFKLHGLQEYVTVEHADVCAQGFGEHLNNKADAVFLDLPHPWLAIPHAYKSLKNEGGRICSFSPCIEQVQKSCAALRELCFEEISTMEILQTQYTLLQRNLNKLNLSFLKNEKNPDEEEKHEKEVARILTASPPASQPGHTGYLTFATLPPIWARRITTEELDTN